MQKNWKDKATDLWNKVMDTTPGSSRDHHLSGAVETPITVPSIEPNGSQAIALNEEQLKDVIDTWSGETVLDIAFSGIDYSDPLLASANVKETVPVEYRGEAWSSKLIPNLLGLQFDPMDKSKGIVEIVAIDRSDMALVTLKAVFDKEEHGKASFTSMPKEEAFALVDKYRASQELDSDIEKLPASPGKVYDGIIVHASETMVLQETAGNIHIVHDTKHLVGFDPRLHLGSPVAISYPHGQVGIVKDTQKEHAISKVFQLSQDEHSL